MEKKKKSTVLIPLVIILILIGSVLAYLFTSDGADNEIQVTNADVTIDEEFDKSNLKPGYNVYQKTVPITNKGENPCFVRVFMDFSDSSLIGDAASDVRTYFSNAKSKPPVPEADTLHSNIDSTIWKLAAEKTWLDKNWVYIDYDGSKKYMTDSGLVTEDATDGLKGLGGYYYYKLPVAPDESTSPLISWVMTYFEDAQKIKIYDILVYTETIQTIGIDGTKYTDADWTDAWKAYLHI